MKNEWKGEDLGIFMSKRAGARGKGLLISASAGRRMVVDGGVLMFVGGNRAEVGKMEAFVGVKGGGLMAKKNSLTESSYLVVGQGWFRLTFPIS